MSRATQRTDQRDTYAAPESWGETFTRSEVFTQYPGRGTSSRLHLDSDPQTIESVAREKLGLIRPGEKLIVVKDVAPTK